MIEKLETFDDHLKEMMKSEEFVKGFPEEKRRLQLAVKLARIRQEQGLSQSKLAKKAGVTQQQLSKLEQAENCNINTFIKVCNSLGLEISLQPFANL
jgi:DNA-binding phage protein